jgi:hypothetical protein
MLLCCSGEQTGVQAGRVGSNPTDKFQTLTLRIYGRSSGLRFCLASRMSRRVQLPRCPPKFEIDDIFESLID